MATGNSREVSLIGNHKMKGQVSETLCIGLLPGRKEKILFELTHQ
jgi:hypothetical protein